MTLRVLHVTGEKTWRGGEIQVLLLIKYCQSIDASIEHILCCRRGTAIDSRAREQQVSVRNLPMRNGLDIASARRLRQLCDREEIDIVHCHSPNAHGIAIISGTLGNGARIITTKRTVFPIKSNWLSKEKYRRTDKVICISQEVEASVRDSVRVDTEVIPSIYAPQDFHAVSWTEAWPDMRAPKVVGYVAAMTVEKDPEAFLEVAKAITDKREDVAFVWVGDGPMRDQIIAAILRLGLQDKVLLAGHRENILDWISALDIFFFPSKSEGLGSSVLQAFHCQVPVVASDAGGLKSLITHEVNGLTAPVGDVAQYIVNLEALLEDSALRERLISNATETLRRFAPDQLVPLVINSYRQVTSLRC